MATVPIDAFPAPARGGVAEVAPILQSSPTQGLVLSRRRSQLRPRLLELTYENRDPSIARTLRLHYEQHCGTTWDLTVPGSGTVRVRWAQGPEFSWRSNRNVTARALLEVCTARD